MKFVPGNQITLLKNGSDFFPAIIDAIHAATIEVRVETYIFLDDEQGHAIAAALAAAATRGVAVHVIVDGIGSRDTEKSFFENLRKSGAKVLYFRPETSWLKFRKSQLRRIHRKIILIDGVVGFVGGINLLHDMTDSMSDIHPRYDYAVKVTGPVLADIYPSVLQLWRVVALQKWGRRTPLPTITVARSEVGTMPAKFVQRDNLRHRAEIEREYLRAIAAARERVLIVSPYFLPGRRLRLSLASAAKRGVAVSLLLQGRADHPLLKLATGALYHGLLRAGVRIFEYEKSMLHAKVAAIDDQWATVGSSNLDPFSLFLNREANIVIDDRAFAQALRHSVEAEIADGASETKPGDWHQRTRWQRPLTWFAYRFARLVSGWVGLKGERRE